MIRLLQEDVHVDVSRGADCAGGSKRQSAAEPMVNRVGGQRAIHAHDDLAEARHEPSFDSSQSRIPTGRKRGMRAAPGHRELSVDRGSPLAD